MSRLFAILLLAVIAGCANKSASAIFLSFSESGSDGEAYPVRMLVTDQYLRIEDGDAQDGFIVFDRAKKIVYSVSHVDKTTLVVKAQPINLEPPREFIHKVVRDDERLHDVDGKHVTHQRLFSNNERCFDVYSAEGLLPQAVAALREYYRVLAGEQAALQSKIPASFQSACDLAEFVFLPGRHLEFGFPVRQTNHAGVTRQLLDFKIDVPVKPVMFEIPADYKQITPAGMRGK